MCKDSITGTLNSTRQNSMLYYLILIYYDSPGFGPIRDTHPILTHSRFYSNSNGVHTYLFNGAEYLENYQLSDIDSMNF